MNYYTFEIYVLDGNGSAYKTIEAENIEEADEKLELYIEHSNLKINLQAPSPHYELYESYTQDEMQTRIYVANSWNTLIKEKGMQANPIQGFINFMNSQGLGVCIQNKTYIITPTLDTSFRKENKND